MDDAALYGALPRKRVLVCRQICGKSGIPIGNWLKSDGQSSTRPVEPAMISDVQANFCRMQWRTGKLLKIAAAPRAACRGAKRPNCGADPAVDDVARGELRAARRDRLAVPLDSRLREQLREQLRGQRSQKPPGYHLQERRGCLTGFILATLRQVSARYP